MATYLIKSGIYMTCFYLIYWLLVRHKQNFNLNRIFILIVVLVSGILPFVALPSVGLGSQQIGQVLEPIIISDLNRQHLPKGNHISLDIFPIVYIAGLSAVAIRFIAGLAILYHVYQRSPRKNFHGFTAVIMTGKQSPFTFFNLLFINRSDFEGGNINELTVHEKVHLNQLHTMDLILMEILTIIHWFNPFVWLFKKDLKSEHEFLADEEVIKKGYDKTRYQSLLLQSHEGITHYLANNFNYSILKKRLIMMKKQKSDGIIKMNYVMVWPICLMCAMILFFNFQMERRAGTIPDVMPVYNEGEKAFFKKISKTIKYPKEARIKNIQGTVYVSFTVNQNGKIEQIEAGDEKYNLLKEIVVIGYSETKTSDRISEELSILQKESERVIALLGDFQPAQKNGEPINTRMTLPIKFLIK